MLPRDEYSQYWQEADTLTGPQVALVVKEPAASMQETQEMGVNP